MPGRPRRVPQYCRHKASGQAVVRIAGRDRYLGAYGSPESHERYQRLLAEHIRTSTVFGVAPSYAAGELTIAELLAQYWGFASTYYTKDGRPTGELASLRLAFRPLRALYGSCDVAAFGPLALKAVRKQMIEAGVTRKRINQHVGRIRRMFKWGVSEELVPVTIYQALLTLAGLRAGRSKAKESVPVRPVKREHVEAVLPFLPRQLQAMVQLQFLLGCRPQEITLLRPCDVKRRDKKVWKYVPLSHKTEHHGDERKIYIGREAQRILLPWLDREETAFCFSPAESREAFDAERRRTRGTPHTPSSRARTRMRAPKKRPGCRYTTLSYGAAIRKACERAAVPRWSPNQLRHARGTMVRKKFGLEASQVVLGHKKADVTQIYAEKNFALAKKVVKKLG